MTPAELRVAKALAKSLWLEAERHYDQVHALAKASADPAQYEPLLAAADRAATQALRAHVALLLVGQGDVEMAQAVVS